MDSKFSIREETFTMREPTATDAYSELFQAPVSVVPEEDWPVVLDALGIQRSLTGLLASHLSRSLLQRHQRTLRLAECNNLPLSFLGYAPVFPAPHVYPGLDCDWVVMSITIDPAFREWGRKFHFPALIKEQVERILQAGIEFDAIFIAHEIPQGLLESGKPVARELVLPSPDPRVLRRLEFLEGIVTSWWNFVKGVAAAIVGMAATTVETIAATNRVHRPTYRDPVLLGVQFDATCQVGGQPLGMWYYLAHWHWPVEWKERKER